MHSSLMVFRKQSESPDGIARLALEASVLELVAHPNVVELLNKRIDANKASLQLAEVDATALSKTALNVEDYSRVIMNTAATLAYIHERGVAHNRINGDHVLVRNTDKTVVLCGFGGSTFDADEYIQTRDVVALGALLRDYMERNHDPFRARIHGVLDGSADLGRSLLSVATIAADGEMSAVAFATALRQLHEGAPVDKPRVSAQRHFRFQWRLVAAVIIPFAFVGGGIAVLDANPSRAAATPPPTSTVPICAPVPQGETAIDTDGDGCPNFVTFGNGVVSIDGERYEVGLPTDKLLAGDWFGTNLSTLALLRPTTGEIYVFSTWPSTRATAAPTLVANIPGATSFTNQRSSHHDVLVVTSPKGQATVDPYPVVAAASTTTTTVVAVH